MDGFQCYLCNGMQSSLDVCDNKIEKAHCKTHAPGADRCGIFSFIDGSTGVRVYGKSCVYQKACDDKDYFCQTVASHLGDAKECQILCCTEEFCNYKNTAYTQKFNTSDDKDILDIDDNEDSEVCDWVDASGTLGVSGFLTAICAVYAILMIKLLI